MKTAVCYYRHSAEDKQENSVPIQKEQILEKATLNNIVIVGEESDEGVSGITANRPGFRRLFENWVTNKEIEFDYVLVLDASRWGRFQNPDEAAYYDFLCTKYGRRVVYIDRGFNFNPQEQLIRSMITMVDRFAAGEYSRQLSIKVWRGCVKVIEQGYSAGGMAPFGLRRQLLNEKKQPIGLLESGEHKAIANQRVVFVPGLDNEQRLVKLIFSLFIEEGLSYYQISEEIDKKLSEGRIRSILANEKYSGSLIYNKTSSKLKSKRSRNNIDSWVINPNAIEPIISKATFQKVQFLRQRIRYAIS